MAAQIIYPTPYPAVNSILNELLSKVQTILGKCLIGMYLYGSLALDDFDPRSSDIDFVVVTTTELPQALFLSLKAMHAHLARDESKWATELESSYIPQDALRRYDPPNTHHPHIDRGGGSLNIEQHDTDWVVQRYVLRTHGLLLVGPSIETLIDPISAQELRQASLDLFNY